MTLKHRKRRFKRTFMVDKTSFLAHFEKYLAELLDGDRSPLSAIARYSALDGGKRIRPACVYLGALASGNECDEEALLALAAGVELVHSYSLVHDDLPSMDNDAVRRGKPSTHVAFGEANAILAGDEMLSVALAHLIRATARYGKPFAEAAYELGAAAVDMTHGQAIEIAGCSTRDELFYMYSLKTGALILGALRAGAIAAEADSDTLVKVTNYGRAVGLCFQLSDDLIDGDGAVKLLGKECARSELDRALSDALAYAENLPKDLSDFAMTLARRSK